jgi:hypothetical protein
MTTLLKKEILLLRARENGIWECGHAVSHNYPCAALEMPNTPAGEKMRGERGVEVPLLHKLSTVPYQVFLGIGTL